MKTSREYTTAILLKWYVKARTFVASVDITGECVEPPIAYSDDGPRRFPHAGHGPRSWGVPSEDTRYPDMSNISVWAIETDGFPPCLEPCREFHQGKVRNLGIQRNQKMRHFLSHPFSAFHNRSLRPSPAWRASTVICVSGGR